MKSSLPLSSLLFLFLFSCSPEEPSGPSPFQFKMDRNQIQDAIHGSNWVRLAPGGGGLCPISGDDCMTSTGAPSRMRTAFSNFKSYWDGDSTIAFFSKAENQSDWETLFPNTWDKNVADKFKNGDYKVTLGTDSTLLIYAGDLHSSPTYLYAILPSWK